MLIGHVTSERVPREVGANVLTLLMLGTQFHTELKLTSKINGTQMKMQDRENLFLAPV